MRDLFVLVGMTYENIMGHWILIHCVPVRSLAPNLISPQQRPICKLLAKKPQTACKTSERGGKDINEKLRGMNSSFKNCIFKFSHFRERPWKESNCKTLIRTL